MMVNSQFVNEFPDRYAAIFLKDFFFFKLGKNGFYKQDAVL